jgi:hypothetical protein
MTTRDRRRSTTLVLLTAAAALLALPAPAGAQQDRTVERKPIGWFAADARIALPRFKQDPGVAAALGVTSENLPTRGLGLAAGAHVYPLRTRRFALGLGAEFLRSRGSNTLEPATTDGPDGPTVKTRFSAFSPQVSLNFGASEGWSYLSGGIGWATYSVEEEPVTTAADGWPRRRTINYGGGARWFMKKHLAFSIDLRFYNVSAQEPDAIYPAMPQMTLMVFSGGFSFK